MVNVTSRFIQSDIPDSEYSVSNDIQLNNDNLTVYIKEDNDLGNRTTDNKASAGNDIILNDFYPDKAIITSYNRIYYAKLSLDWKEQIKFITLNQYHNIIEVLMVIFF